MENEAVHIQVILATTGGGPDQVGSRNQVEADYADDIHCWVLWTLCLLHQVHLMVNRQLSRCLSFFLEHGNEYEFVAIFRKRC